MAENCEKCKFRAKYNQKPNSFIGKFWRWHINFCPGWKAYFTSQSAEKKAELRDKYNFQKYWYGIHRTFQTIGRFPQRGTDTGDRAFCREPDPSGIRGFVLRYVNEELHQRMKLKKRKIKYSAIFCLCWFVFLVILVDGVLKFQTLVDYFGSYALVEITLLLLVILPTLAVYRLTKE